MLTFPDDFHQTNVGYKQLWEPRDGTKLVIISRMTYSGVYVVRWMDRKGYHLDQDPVDINHRLQTDLELVLLHAYLLTQMENAQIPR